MAAGRRGKKRIARLAKELRMKWPKVCALLGEVDGSDRKWTHFNQVVSAELERRLRSYLESSSQEIPAPPAPPMRGDAPVTVPRPAAPIKVDVRGGGREMDARGALHLPSRLWPLPRRFQPGQTGQLLLQWFVMLIGGLAAVGWLLVRQERAEWLVTEGIHGHPLLLIPMA